MSSHKIIYAHIFVPWEKSKPTKCQTISCSNYENCGLYKRGECSWLASFGWQGCVYGKFNEEHGYTKRARKYSEWVNGKKEQYTGALDSLRQHKSILAEVGDYVFLPYAHITMNESVPFLAHGGLFAKENCFLPKSAWTIDNIISMCEFRPQALFGGEILSYQKEEVPKFLKHLSEVFPELFAQLCKTYERARLVVSSFSHVGREAILDTLNPNVGLFVDIHGGHWSWDGEYLTSKNTKASFMLTDKNIEVRVKPAPGVKVKIQDNAQVRSDTVFLS